jgi:hypothetical protein
MKIDKKEIDEFYKQSHTPAGILFRLPLIAYLLEGKIYLEFLKWNTKRLLSKSDLFGIPKQPGVYRIVTSEPFGRLQGQSNIIYIGCSSKGEQGLWLEIGNLLNPQRQHIYTLKTIRASGLQLEYEYVTTLAKEAGDIEYHLLDRYEREHLELPPANRAKPKHINCNYCKSDVVLQYLY